MNPKSNNKNQNHWNIHPKWPKVIDFIKQIKDLGQWYIYDFTPWMGYASHNTCTWTICVNLHRVTNLENNQYTCKLLSNNYEFEIFFSSCLTSWLEQDTSCPTCRTSLSEGQQVDPNSNVPDERGAAPPPQAQQQPPQNHFTNHFFHFDGMNLVLLPLGVIFL